MDTNTWILIGVAGGTVILFFTFYVITRRDPVSSAIAKARETEDVGPIVEAIKNAGATTKDNVWHKAIDALWSAYERELATKLIKEAYELHTSESMQHWVRRVVEVEPEMAMSIFGREFILEKLELPEEAIPKPGPRLPRRGDRVTSKKKSKSKGRKNK